MSRSQDQRPVLVAIAGPNGAGKTTFFHAHLKQAALRFVNADVLAGELELDPYAAARVADALRRDMVRQRESFVFETVFSDPFGDKLEFLRSAGRQGYDVVLCFIGISGPEVSEERVAMRVSQGGHDVPTEKLQQRFSRTLSNLRAAIRELPHVLVFDNDDLSEPFRKVAETVHGRAVFVADPLPRWLSGILRSAV
jgi:predicted ABC-type ATPase